VAEVRRALEIYRDAARWRKLQRQAMARDFGWGRAAQAYADIYARIRSTS
jgi:starch synthase